METKQHTNGDGNDGNKISNLKYQLLVATFDRLLPKENLLLPTVTTCYTVVAQCYHPLPTYHTVLTEIILMVMFQPLPVL